MPGSDPRIKSGEGMQAGGGTVGFHCFWASPNTGPSPDPSPQGAGRGMQ